AVIGRIAEGQVICYRGTLGFDDETRPESQRILDWVQDFHAELVAWRGLSGLCHGGFTRAVDSLEEGLKPFLSTKNRIFTGHSKGGAMAQLAARWYCATRQRPSVCSTFGAPRAGNEQFALAFENSPVSLV